MNPRALFGLCLRPALAVTVILLAALAVGIGYVESVVRDSAGSNGPLIFQIAYDVLTVALLISLGSFISKVTSGIEHIRLGRTVPALRRHVTAGVVLVIPFAATLALGYLAWAVPEQLRAAPIVAQWSVCGFLFCLGLAFGGSWLLAPALVILASQYRFIAEHLRDTPVAFSVLTLVGAAALVARWRARFLPGASNVSEGRRRLPRLSANNTDALERRTGESLSDVPDASSDLRTTMPDLLKAGDYERFGQHRGGLHGRMAVWVFGSYAVFFGLAAIFAHKSGASGWRQFGERVFLAATADAWVTLARVSFAVIAGMAGYITAVTFDGSLRQDLWHPISRRRLACVTFWARVRQNAAFAAFHLLVAAVLLASFAVTAHRWPAAAALRAFLLPGLLVGMLAPGAQTLFPRGADTFHAKANPLVQLAAGLTGGVFCLTIVHGTAHWPTTALQSQMSDTMLVASFGVAALLAYAGYWTLIQFRFATADVSRRQR